MKKTKSFVYTEKLNNKNVYRFKKTSDNLKEQRDEFDKLTKEGKIVCLSDLIANYGM